jgi:hypothetical protein
MTIRPRTASHARYQSRGARRLDGKLVRVLVSLQGAVSYLRYHQQVSEVAKGHKGRGARYPAHAGLAVRQSHSAAASR